MKKKIFGSIFIAFLFFASAHALFFRARAQTAAPEFFVTWRSTAYAPFGFQGKVLPAANGFITVSAELVDQGKIVDVSKQTVYWYLNNNFLQGGQGLATISFRAPDSAGGTIDVRVEMPRYAGGGQLKTITIPIAAPEAVIESPFPDGVFSASPLQLTGVSYFFNVKDASQLSFDWSINGQAPGGSENPDRLNIKIRSDAPAGFPVAVTLNIRNANNPLEVGTAKTTLTYNP